MNHQPGCNSPAKPEEEVSSEDLAGCIRLLEKFASQHKLVAALPEDQRIALLKAAGQLSRPDKTELLRRNKLIQKEERRKRSHNERKARADTGIRTARQAKVFTAPERMISAENGNLPERPELQSPRNCYICKAEFTRLHFFYDALCPNCAAFNYEKRFQTAPLTGQVALITGSRVKIGYQAALMMLRAGARVIATTRFPVDSASRYSQEKDFKDWCERLHIYGLDLRHTPSVEIFCNYFEQKYGRLDLLINNAAQTVRRPPGFYSHLLARETCPLSELPGPVRLLLGDFDSCRKQLWNYSENHPESRGVSLNTEVLSAWRTNSPGLGLRASAELSQIPYSHDYALPAEKVFPKGELDADLQQVDLRTTNSWRLRLGEIETSELLEIQLVNAVAPFVLANRLAPLMQKNPTGQKHIVNVTAMEGKFHRFKKADRHPHTNMAKAALNMLTHTSASGLAKHGIFMNAVDTGWVTDEDPAALAALKQEVHDFQPPLDIVDGAARVCDPFFHGILTGRHWCGKFLKDYFPIDW